MKDLIRALYKRFFFLAAALCALGITLVVVCMSRRMYGPLLRPGYGWVTGRDS